MSKRELKKYLRELPKNQLEEHILDLYAKFKNVKTYYDFVFNPDEQKLVEEAKFKINKEYFPQSRRKPKARRSVAQKYIKHFKTLGVDPHIIAEVMVYNLEIAQAFSGKKLPRQDAFYISLLRSFREAIDFTRSYGLQTEYAKRLINIRENAWEQNWFNKEAFILD